MGKSDNPAAIARRALDDVPDDGGIDPQLANELIEAIVDYPTFATACAACGVTARSVRSMLERGAQVGAPPSLRAFSRGLARADADNAKVHYMLAQKLLGEGNSSAARLVADLLHKRWNLEEGNDIMAMLSGGKRSDGLKARLERPSPLLGALLSDMLAHPNDAWAGLLKGAGYARTMAPAPEHEPDKDPDGSGV